MGRWLSQEPRTPAASRAHGESLGTNTGWAVLSEEMKALPLSRQPALPGGSTAAERLRLPASRAAAMGSRTRYRHPDSVGPGLDKAKAEAEQSTLSGQTLALSLRLLWALDS